MTAAPNKVTGSFASSRNYSLPKAVIDELRMPESIEDLLNRSFGPASLENIESMSSERTMDDDERTRMVGQFMTALNQHPDTLTANAAPAYSTSRDPVLDWNKDALATLRIIWQARSIHEGKGMRDHVFYSCLAWLYRTHPRTFFTNLHLLIEQVCIMPDIKVPLDNGVIELLARPQVSHGYFKEYAQSSFGIVLFTDFFGLSKFSSLASLSTLLLLSLDEALEDRLDSAEAMNDVLWKGSLDAQFRQTFAVRKRGVKRIDWEKMMEKRKRRIAKLPEKYKKYHNGDKHYKAKECKEKVLTQLGFDKKFRVLYILVARIFAEKLRQDILILEELRHCPAAQKYAIASRFSLAGKWAPSPQKSADKQLLLSTAISAILWPDMDETVTMRVAYQTKCLAPLRSALDIVEVKMAAGEWAKINYSRVPSRAMAANKLNFFFHDEERFSAFLSKVEAGKKKISGTTLWPHELVAEAVASGGKVELAAKARLERKMLSRWTKLNSRIIDAQWKSMVTNVREAAVSRLENCLAVVDVSDSMGSLDMRTKFEPYPLLVAISLGILVAQLVIPPWYGTFITFSAQPQINRFRDDDSLSDIAKGMHKANWGSSTNVLAVFTLILGIAKQNKLPPDAMIKKLFIFSDMAFNDADREYTEKMENTIVQRTPHQIATEMYAEAGYELPRIVYWNIAGDTIGGTAMPVQADTPGVEIISGHSATLFKKFIGLNDTKQAEQEIVSETAVKEFDDADITYDKATIDHDLHTASNDDEGESGNVAKYSKNSEKVTPAEKLAKVLQNPSFTKLKVVD